MMCKGKECAAPSARGNSHMHGLKSVYFQEQRAAGSANNRVSEPGGRKSESYTQRAGEVASTLHILACIPSGEN